MSRVIFNQVELGSYDFGLQLIEINNEANFKSKDDIIRILNTSDLHSLTDTELEIYKTYKHEVTHQLDSTATLWGMEYTNRLYSWFKNPEDNLLEVLSLNDAEIQMHSKLINVSEKIGYYSKILFSLEYDVDCGVYVRFHYHDEDGNSVHSTSVSMLSLLEGHAYAQEQAVSCRIHEHNNDVVALTLLEKKISEATRNFQLTEYSCFLALINQIFPNLKLSQRLNLMIFSARFSLSVSGFFIAMIPDAVLSHIFAKAQADLVSTLKMEMCRGMHRSSYALIVLVCLAMHNEQTGSIDNGTSYTEMEDIFLGCYLSNFKSLDVVKQMLSDSCEVEYELLSEQLIENGAELAARISAQFVNKSWYDDDITKLSLPDFNLSSCDVVSPPKRLLFDTVRHEDIILKKVIELKKAMKRLGVVRQHLAPHVYHDWLVKIRNGEIGYHFYPHSTNG
ncbi:hypothetical protein [Vibrio parahaemolyticus]|uniref:hypothetical protein n=1 Tax=Vibrio parahaemolyticus TaxID=670 RepID=UPI00353076A3|nr:hypothetical protein [Vibrio parahaemolyticus]HCG6962694.1 hypothetical protein [Vibrio parahaemolyticus]HCM0793427.1 hypothetical protein [Vibrio parahaemolyticus]